MIRDPADLSKGLDLNGPSSALPPKLYASALSEAATFTWSHRGSEISFSWHTKWQMHWRQTSLRSACVSGSKLATDMFRGAKTTRRQRSSPCTEPTFKNPFVLLCMQRVLTFTKWDLLLVVWRPLMLCVSLVTTVWSCWETAGLKAKHEDDGSAWWRVRLNSTEQGAHRRPHLQITWIKGTTHWTVEKVNVHEHKRKFFVTPIDANLLKLSLNEAIRLFRFTILPSFSLYSLTRVMLFGIIINFSSSLLSGLISAEFTLAKANCSPFASIYIRTNLWVVSVLFLNTIFTE